MKQTTIDPSKELQLFLRVARDGSKKFICLDSFGAAYSLSGLTFELFVKDFPHSTSKVISLTTSSGLVIGGSNNNELTATFTDSITNLKAKDYYWELVCTSRVETWINGIATVHNGKFDGVSTDIEELTITLSGGEITISIESTSSSSSVSAASQSEVDAGIVSSKYVAPSTLASKALLAGTYATTLNFSTDQDIFKDATGLSITFTLGSTNVNGVGIILRLNKPTAVTFPVNFEADASSAALDATKMNVYFLIYFSNWNGTGTARVIYKNALFTSV